MLLLTDPFGPVEQMMSGRWVRDVCALVRQSLDESFPKATVFQLNSSREATKAGGITAALRVRA